MWLTAFRHVLLKDFYILKLFSTAVASVTHGRGYIHTNGLTFGLLGLAAVAAKKARKSQYLCVLNVDETGAKKC